MEDMSDLFVEKLIGLASLLPLFGSAISKMSSLLEKPDLSSVI